MIRVREIKVDILEDNIDNILSKVSRKIKININDILEYKIVRKSIDARKKPEIFYVYTLDLLLKNEKSLLVRHPELKAPNKIDVEIKKYTVDHSPIIVGAGPSGLFCALVLARAGANPIIIEKGESVEDREITVKNFFRKNILNENSNIQFGEGGAGTFSDGKLNTSVNDFRNYFVLETFVNAGAYSKILYENKPHIGTDILIKVIKNIREEIISLGGKFYFNTKLIDINIKKNISVTLSNNSTLTTDRLVLAIGNSARDSFKMLSEVGIKMNPKPFAVGYRVSHTQEQINYNNYGEKHYKILPACDYKLTYTTKNKIPVFSFCMCPGGYVVNSSSEKGQMVINGMSYSKRNSRNANSAIIMGVNFNSIDDAINFQIDIEKKAYRAGNGLIPITKYIDFKNNKKTETLGNVKPEFKGDYTLANLRGILPSELEYAFIEGMESFSKKIKDFNTDDCIVAAIESRTSSPVRMERDKNLQSNIKGIYPIGEGAGYAGGIMSAAIDGIKAAQSILEVL